MQQWQLFPTLQNTRSSRRLYRDAGRPIVYLDETWLNAHHFMERCWIDYDGKGVLVPSGRGGRLIVFQSGWERGCMDSECIADLQRQEGYRGLSQRDEHPTFYGVVQRQAHSKPSTKVCGSPRQRKVSQQCGRENSHKEQHQVGYDTVSGSPQHCL